MVKDMKKVLVAFIEQVLQFDSEAEYQKYIHDLKTGRPQKFKEVDKKTDTAGKVFLTIRKQYNNNAFPD